MDIPHSLSRSAFVEPGSISSQRSAAQHAVTMHDGCMDAGYFRLEYLYSSPRVTLLLHVEKV